MRKKVSYNTRMKCNNANSVVVVVCVGDVCNAWRGQCARVISRHLQRSIGSLRRHDDVIRPCLHHLLLSVHRVSSIHPHPRFGDGRSQLGVQGSTEGDVLQRRTCRWSGLPDDWVHDTTPQDISENNRSQAGEYMQYCIYFLQDLYMTVLKFV